MAVGDTRVINGVEYEVVWDGGEGLTGTRETKNVSDVWTPPKRLYNKKSEYWTKPREKKETLDEPREKVVLRDSGTETSLEHRSPSEQQGGSGEPGTEGSGEPVS